MGLGGRLLFYIFNNKKGGLGGIDVYSIVLWNFGDWFIFEEFKNLGLMLNSWFNDFGIIYFLEYSGKVYYYWWDCCIGDMDFWCIKLGLGIFLVNVLWFVGVILDENLKLIGKGGFVEFIFNYELNVYFKFILIKGIYIYMVVDSIEVVWFFLEVFGYYFECDIIYYLVILKWGEIIRDIFILIFFDYICKNFKLKYSIFYNGEVEFD